MRNRGVAIGLAAAALMAGLPSANVTPAQVVATNVGASQHGPQGQSGRLPSASNFLAALLDGGSFGYKPFRPTYRKRPPGSVARDKRNARSARNRLRMKGRR